MSSHSLPFWLPTFVCHPWALDCWAALLLGRYSSSPCSASELHRDVHITHLCAQALISSVFRFAFGWTCSRTRFRLADCGWHRCRLYFDRSLTCGYIFFLRRGNLYLYRSSDLVLVRLHVHVTHFCVQVEVICISTDHQIYSWYNFFKFWSHILFLNTPS